MKITRLALLLPLFLVGCTVVIQPKKEVVFVSIPPLRWVVAQIVDTATTRIEVFVPESSSPESYEPTVRQIRALADAKAYISIGLIDFEQVLEGQIKEIAPKTPLLNLAASAGIEPLPEIRHHQDQQHDLQDPHIWLSPRRMATIGQEVARFLGELTPDSASAYRDRAQKLVERIDTLDDRLDRIAHTARRKQFAIGHPALGYLADDYGLQQIVIEDEGKEPSVRMMKQLVDSLQRTGVKSVLYQRQTSDAAARAIAREVAGGRAVMFDPLVEKWLDNMHELADTLQVILNE